LILSFKPAWHLLIYLVTNVVDLWKCFSQYVRYKKPALRRTIRSDRSCGWDRFWARMRIRFFPIRTTHTKGPRASLQVLPLVIITPQIANVQTPTGIQGIDAIVTLLEQPRIPLQTQIVHSTHHCSKTRLSVRFGRRSS
jgi:hypothetical protein